MTLITTPDVLDAIWKALSDTPGKTSRRQSAWENVAREGSMIEIDLEDAFLTTDRRLDRHGLKPDIFAVLRDLPWRWIYHRPMSRFDEPTGFRSLFAAEVGALLIFLERLGFAVDPEPLCTLLRPKLAVSAMLTGPELEVLFHDRTALRTPPLTLAINASQYFNVTTQKLRTERGYRVEYAVGDDGVPLWLTVRAPKYRRRPEPTLTNCAECGVSYMKGSPSEEKAHRARHRLQRQATHPEPDRRFLSERERDPLGAPWVSDRSAAWKHELVYRRAFAFKREAGYDFSQWGQAPRENPGAVGYLFADDDGRVVGAAGFQPQDNGSSWRLDFIWLAPGYRRQGYLARHWEQFRQRFGAFEVEHPLSDSMKAFLRKRGAVHLIRDESSSGPPVP